MRITIVLVTVIVSFALFSCTSQPVDMGVFNPENIPEEELVSLVVERLVQVHRMDGKEVNWRLPKQDDRLIRIPSGLHTFDVTFLGADGSHTLTPAPIKAKFEKGTTYKIDFDFERERGRTKVIFYVCLYNDFEKGDIVSF